MKNLFIEGPIQTGKSTLIREILVPHMKRVGGFTCQRLLRKMPDMCATPVPGSATLHPVGYRLTAANAPINLVINAEESEVLTEKECLDAGIFKLLTPTGAKVFDAVFETIGVDLMREALLATRNAAKPEATSSSEIESPNKQSSPIAIVLLDEIGGHELLNDAFRETLYELLNSGAPCIGVIKHEESTRQMVAKLPPDEASSIIAYNQELHEIIGGDILHFERGNTAMEAIVRDKISDFVSEALGAV